MTRERQLRGRPLFLGGAAVLVLGAVIAFFGMRCGRGVGVGSGGGNGVGARKDKKVPLIPGGKDGQQKPEKKVVPPCRLHLDSKGLTLDEKPATVEQAVARCRESGEANLHVTGGANYGTLEEIRNALEAAGVKVFTREP